MVKKSKQRKYEDSEPIYYDYYYTPFIYQILYSLIGMIAIALLGYVFYRSLLLSLIISPIGIKFNSYMNTLLRDRRKKALTLQFKDMLYSLSSSVSSGMSIENSISSTIADMKMQFGEENVYIVDELELMQSRLNTNQNIEDIFADFGNRSAVEEIKSFANIFEISKRTGGNIVDIIRNTSNIITDKIEIKLEMDTMLSGKKMEQKVLSVMPILMVYFMTVSAGDFMQMLFTTIVGRITSTIVLTVIIIGYFWSKKIADIKI